MRGWLAGKPDVGVVIAPNFGIGAVLMMQFAARAARYFESVEIIEQHHPRKLDAPSGTATHTARQIAAGPRRGRPRPGAGRHHGRGAGRARRRHRRGTRPRRARHRPGRPPGGAVRHPGETLTIRHDSYDRVSFMPGVLLAVRAVRNRPGLTVGLDALLD